ncbi:MAG: cyclic pyranopterin phosphate synthase [Planctomycetota bacterium]|jgi:cyclic pyranopterin phosphate synthase
MDASNDPEKMAANGLSHLTEGPSGLESRMVDVHAKPSTEREATAEAWVTFPSGILSGLLESGGPKGPILEVARVAGILAAKRTGDLIPMCHPLGLDVVEIQFTHPDPDRLHLTCRTACTGRTGVEMEALTGVSVAALCIYDMTKALSKEILIERIRLLSKKGGKSGHWEAR